MFKYSVFCAIIPDTSSVITKCKPIYGSTNHFHIMDKCVLIIQQKYMMDIDGTRIYAICANITSKAFVVYLAINK